MKDYPTRQFEIEFEDGNATVIEPTEEALKNFYSYLDEDEKIIYDNLPIVEQLQIRISCDPFRAFLNKKHGI